MTLEDIVNRNKLQNDFKNFEFEIISNFSITSPINMKILILYQK